MTHLDPATARKAIAAAIADLDALDQPQGRKTEKAEEPSQHPAGRLRYPYLWGTWRLCYRHNLTFDLCPTKARCMICRVLSRVGWGFIHLSQWVSKRSSK